MTASGRCGQGFSHSQDRRARTDGAHKRVPGGQALTADLLGRRQAPDGWQRAAEEAARPAPLYSRVRKRLGGSWAVAGQKVVGAVAGQNVRPAHRGAISALQAETWRGRGACARLDGTR